MKKASLVTLSLLTLLAGCPGEGPQAPPPPVTGSSDGSDSAPTDAPADGASKEDPARERELTAWKAIEAQGAWGELLPRKLKQDVLRAKLEAAVGETHGDAMQRLALLILHSPLEDTKAGAKILNGSAILRRHLAKHPALSGWTVDDPKTVAMVMLPDAGLMGRTAWLHFATGWTSVQDGTGSGAFHLPTASDLRTAMAHAQHGRWEQAIPLYRDVFVRLARLNTDRQGSKSKQAWDKAYALLEDGDLTALQDALNAWFQTFITPKPARD